ncbi:hypothetical protein Pflav_089420 [Phytohabitans flavus]|uniref:Zinc finger CGNR domain-containing protein n=2 Tax=Phytohabitans flavus TaxID=1076124 RepID=A0A6F8Y8U1_9ACTN|nr:CGNR zinc finger domain-containing protein [Phytohabitans flavus]BCB82532.1 hypothetical protein Pflav_089420 [Phytohabitans flavus]
MAAANGGEARGHSAGAPADGGEASSRGAGGDDARGPRAELDRLAAGLPLRARFTEGGMGLAPTAGGVQGLLAEIVAAMVLAERDGIWSRLKICREDSCQWTYYDRSKNSSKCWCGASCGNRNKTRAYRQRRVVGSARA